MPDQTPALRPEDMASLLESGRELNTEVSIDLLLNTILTKAATLTDSSDTSILLKHDNRDALYFAAATGDKADWVMTTFGKYSPKDVPVNASKAGQVFSSRQSIIENSVEDHFKGVDLESKKNTQSMVCVPLCVGESRLGAMQVLNRRTGNYSDYDVTLLEHFADQASVAIRNAQMFETLLAHSGLYTLSSPHLDMPQMLNSLESPAWREQLTVVFADLHGFTQFCQSLTTPDRVQQRLNEFIRMLAEEVISHDGMVNKFLGDGLMALFRDDNHAERAVEAAFGIVDQFDVMKARWNDDSSEQLDFLDIGVGIATDEVTLGAFGSERVRDFTAIGPTVNLAAAFELQARDGRRVIVNHHTLQAVAKRVKWAQLDDFELKKPGQNMGIRHKRYHIESLQIPAHDLIFVSHSHADADYVEHRLISPLKNVHHIDTWYSSEDIPSGSIWAAEIRKALARCSHVVVIVSRNSSQSDWVRLEVDLAFSLPHLRGQIIPIQIDDTAPADVNEYLSAIQFIDASGEGAKVHDLLAGTLARGGNR